MLKKRLNLVFIISLFTRLLIGQADTYVVEKAYFSSNRYDEFSPVYFTDGIVFCSNRNLGLSSHSTSKNKPLFKILYIDTLRDRDWQGARLFSKEITTIFNDGPVTFNKSMDTIYFSRNQDVSSKFKDVVDQRNYLGIFYAVFIDGKWQKIRDLRINNEWYNVTTPYLSPDGRKLYFASDKPGGYGGSDLYYSEWKNDWWDDPVNLGPEINTPGNESYPFINSSGELFFSSDGHPGMGGKDIYFSIYNDTAWMNPVDLDPPINSSDDDFGIITNAEMSEGYFSTTRNKTIDIYHFKTLISQPLYNIIQRENRYCFRFSDNGAITVDTTNLRYVWDFGDDSKGYGSQVLHCFKTSGTYPVKLDIIDRSSGNIFFSKLSYDLELYDFVQPYIRSVDTTLLNEPVLFDGRESNLPGYKILEYTWDFGDGNRANGSHVEHTFSKSGNYLVNMGLRIEYNSTGEIRRTGISKRISVFANNNDKAGNQDSKEATTPSFPDINTYKNARIMVRFSAESEAKQPALYAVELVSSGKMLGTKSPIFNNVPDKYKIREIFNPVDSTYSYVIDQQMNLMATYPAYRELHKLGFKNIRIKLFGLTDPAERELYELIKINGINTDYYFDISDRLTSNAYIMLDQIVKLLNRHPEIRMEVAVYTDSQGSAAENLKSTQSRAQLLVNYLISRGIKSSRLIPVGYGSSNPIAPNFLEKDRRLNRRIEFNIIK